MKYQILNTPYYKQRLDRTEIQIFCEQPYTIITRDVVGDATGKSKDEQIQLVLDQMNIEYDPSDKVNELDSKQIKLDKALEKADTKLSEVDEAIANMKKESQITQGALIELMNKVLPIVTQLQLKKEDEVSENAPTTGDDDNAEKGGETGDGNVTSN